MSRITSFMDKKNETDDGDAREGGGCYDLVDQMFKSVYNTTELVCVRLCIVVQAKKPVHFIFFLRRTAISSSGVAISGVIGTPKITHIPSPYFAPPYQFTGAFRFPRDMLSIVNKIGDQFQLSQQSCLCSKLI